MLGRKICCANMSACLFTLLMLAPRLHGWQTISHRSPSYQKYHQTSIEMVMLGNRQRPWNRSVKTLVRNPVSSKPRPIVNYDPVTGTITDPVSDLNSQQPWRLFKTGFYKRVDLLGSLVAKLKPRPRLKTRIRESYHQVVEELIFEDTTVSTPGERLMKEYKQRVRPLPVIQPNDSLFDSFKESIYSISDALFQISQPKTSRNPPIEAFKASVQPNIAQAVQVREALPQLSSRNPIRRWWAERSIRLWEREQKRREEALERERQIQAIKEAVYDVVDTFQAGVNLVVETPQTIANAASATQKASIAAMELITSVPSEIQSVADTIVSFPQLVNLKVTEVQRNVERTVQSTQQFVADVVAIPRKVVETVEGTQRKVQSTVKALEDVVTTTKILTGLEKPPPPPPKNPTLDELGWDIAGGVIKTSFQIAWLLGKTTLRLSWKGAQALATLTSSSKSDTIVMTTADVNPAPPTVPPPIETLVRSANIVEKEQLKDESWPKQQGFRVDLQSSGNDKVDDLEIEVQRVKQAAIAATMDVIQVETNSLESVNDDL